jgi:hypothetical protein
MSRAPKDYQRLGPMIAMPGFFTFGWIGSALVFVMNKIPRLEGAGLHHDDAAAKHVPFGN